MPQIYDVLKQEHEQVAQMLDKLEGKSDKKGFEQLFTMLEAHTKAEEKTLYRDLKDAKQTHEVVLEGIEEHRVAHNLLMEMRKLDPKDEVFHAKLSVLKENVMHHVEEEEQTMFPAARQVKDQQWATKMADQFEQQEQQLKQKM